MNARPIHKASVSKGDWTILCDPEKWTLSQVTKHNGKATCPDCLRLLKTQQK